MKAEYIRLIDGRRVRILFNINSIVVFTNESGFDLADMAGSRDVAVFRQLAYACAVEGEATEGRDLALNEIEFGRLMSVENMTQFKEILESQGVSNAKNKGPERSPWWRRIRERTGRSADKIDIKGRSK
jgi:hypothetical protein